MSDDNPITKATSSSSHLTIEDLNRLNEDGKFDNAKRHIIVAPNKKVAVEWAKQFPGWTVLISRKLPIKSTPKGNIE